MMDIEPNDLVLCRESGTGFLRLRERVKRRRSADDLQWWEAWAAVWRNEAVPEDVARLALQFVAGEASREDLEAARPVNSTGAGKVRLPEGLEREDLEPMGEWLVDPLSVPRIWKVVFPRVHQFMFPKVHDMFGYPNVANPSPLDLGRVLFGGWMAAPVRHTARDLVMGLRFLERECPSVAQVLVDLYRNQPRRIAADRRHTSYIPSTYAGVRYVLEDDRVPLLSEPGMVYPEIDDSGMDWLPSLVPDPGPITPPSSIIIWDSTGGSSLAPGRSAPIPLRLCILFMLSVPLSERIEGRRFDLALRLYPDPLDPRRPSLINAIWPNGWHPTRDWPRLLDGLRRVHLASVPLKDGHHLIPFAVRILPNPGDLSSEAVIDLWMPPGVGQGARIHKPTLWRMGCRSATAFRGWLGLAVYWDKYATGRHGRIYATVPVDRTNPSGKHKRHPMANRLPPLDAYNVILLTASPNDARGASGQRMALKRGKDWLESLESKGKVIIERLGRMGGLPWRILESRPVEKPWLSGDALMVIR